MNEDVEPLPLVPAMWMGLRVSKSAGYNLQSEERTTTTYLTVFAPTSYPMRRTHDSISGMARVFHPGPAFLMASTIEKLLCKPLSAATAAL